MSTTFRAIRSGPPPATHSGLSLPAVALAASCAVLILALPGCIKQGNQPPPRPIVRPQPVTTPQETSPKPAALKSDAFGTFDQFRKDLLEQSPHLARANGAFAIGVDVTQSAYAKQVIEYTTKILSDACHYFFDRGDKILIVAWDSRIRDDRAVTFDYADTDEVIGELNAAFEDLENLVDPENWGSNLLDARGYCMEEALRLSKEANGGLCPVVLIFTDIRVPDIEFSRQKYPRKKLGDLRQRFAPGGDAEFSVMTYQVDENTQMFVHALVGSSETVTETASINRSRTPGAVRSPAPVAPTRPPPAPSAPRDTGGIKLLLIVLAVVSLLALIALPFTWRHRLSIGDAKETLRAFGGRVLVQSGRGISPRGTVFLPVPGLEDRALVALEAKGPQLIAVARRGVRLNDGRTELQIPLGKPSSLRIAIDGIAGEHVLELQAAEFFGLNAGAIVGMAIALILIVACIIG